MSAYLITYKPLSENAERGWPAEELKRLVAMRSAGEQVVEAWRFRSINAVRDGERVFLLLQGKRGPAIIGYGSVAGTPSKSDGAWRVLITFERLVDPDVETLVSKDALSAIQGAARTWRTQSSGIRLPESVAEALKRLTLDRSSQVSVQGASSTVYWWVNHKKTFRQEVDGEYLWSPKINQNKAKNVTYDNMTRVLPGDVVFSFAGGEIRAVGLAKGRAQEAVKPKDFGAAGEAWGTDPGWQVPVRFAELARPLRAKDHAKDWAGVLPAKHSPIRASGDGNQGVYLAAIPEGMAAVIRRLLGTQYEQAIERLRGELGPDLEVEAAEAQIQQRTDIGPTTKATLVNARRGQGIYRKNLEQIEKGCRVTDISDRRYLRASHIKPWVESSDFEKLDGNNGLLLSPNVDHLFDGGYISFGDDGEVLIAKTMPGDVLHAMGLKKGMKVGAFRKEQCVYLGWHREHLFGKKGKRSSEGE